MLPMLEIRHGFRVNGCNLKVPVRSQSSPYSAVLPRVCNLLVSRCLKLSAAANCGLLCLAWAASWTVVWSYPGPCDKCRQTSRLSHSFLEQQCCGRPSAVARGGAGPGLTPKVGPRRIPAVSLASTPRWAAGSSSTQRLPSVLPAARFVRTYTLWVIPVRGPTPRYPCYGTGCLHLANPTPAGAPGRLDVRPAQISRVGATHGNETPLVCLFAPGLPKVYTCMHEP